MYGICTNKDVGTSSLLVTASVNSMKMNLEAVVVSQLPVLKRKGLLYL